MRLELTNGDIAYVEQDNIKLVELDGHTCIVGNTTLYGVTENGERFRLSPSYSSSTGFNIYKLDYYEYVSSNYGGSYQWVSSSDEIEWTSVPVSMYADDTYNFDNFGLTLPFMVFLAVFVIFCIFKRR